ncbi:MAG TPA: ribosomal protein L7/L12 [Nannocystis sp.]
MSDADIRDLVRRGQTIEAIRRHRARHGGTLLAARAAIETIRWELTQSTGPALSALEAELEQLIRSGQKILAIKRYREATGLGLKESKDAVDARAAALAARR